MFKKPYARLLLCAFAMASLTGCRFRIPMIADDAVKGSGNIVDEKREVGAFAGLEVHNALEARYEYAEAQSLTLTGDDNLLPLIVTEVVDGRLVIRVAEGKGISSKKPVRALVRGPQIGSFSAQGASRIEADRGAIDDLTIEVHGASHVAVVGVEAKTLTVQAAGASGARLEGHTMTLALKAAGASRIDARKLNAESATVDASGASSLEVAAKAVTGDASGASTIKVVGQPAKRDIATSGASTVTYVK